MQQLGFRAYQAQRAGRAFRHHDEKSIQELAAIRHHRKAYVSRRTQQREELERALRRTLEEADTDVDKAWDAAPPSSAVSEN